MSNKTILKEYLLTSKKKIPFLLDDNNNGKTIMLSGAWGAGKTHFWQNEIEPSLSTQLKEKEKEKACVYVSLYGKDNIEAIKTEILFKAYESIKKENELKKKAISAFGMGSRAFSFSALGLKFNAKELGEKLIEYDENQKIEESEAFIEGGGVICLDDFERKSKKIDLNDLFGFISQLAFDMKCKVVIILNSDVFIGKEAEVFRNVKEKTINKFFYYDPTIEELFESISIDEKYDELNDYKEDILKAIKETEELNARIYIQVLDNCLEWFTSDKDFGENIIRFLVLGNINFILNHLVFETKVIEIDENESQKILDTISSFNSKVKTNLYQEKIIQKIKIDIKVKNNKEYVELYGCIKDSYRSKNFINLVVKNIKKSSNKTIKENNEFYIDYVYNNQNIIRSVSFLELLDIQKSDIEYKNIFNEISNFIESGVLR